MTGIGDFRDLLVMGVTLGARVWGVPETLMTPELVKELTRLGDEATFLNALGLSAAEDRGRLSQLWPFRGSSEAVDVLRHEGEC